MTTFKNSAVLVALTVLISTAAQAQDKSGSPSMAKDSQLVVLKRSPTDSEQSKLDQILQSTKPSSQELMELSQLAMAAISFGQKRFSSDFDFDEYSIKALSQMIDDERSSYSENFKTKLTPVLGSYLGQALILKNGGEWLVMGDGSFAVTLNDDQTIWPMNRVNQQLQEGSDRSIYALYLSAQSDQLK